MRLTAPWDREILSKLAAPPRERVRELRSAPELAVLAVLHAALRAARAALIAAHPTLVDLGPPDEPPTVRYARRLLQAEFVLRRALGAYRSAALAAVRGSQPRRDDALF